MSKQITFSMAKALKEIEKSLEGVAAELESQAQEAIRDIAYATHAGIVAKITSKLKSHSRGAEWCQNYLSGLKIEELGTGEYLIFLDNDRAQRIEDGWGPYNMVPGMLASSKIVGVGSRSGLPWVQHTRPKKPGQTSHKFAYVPLAQHPYSTAPQGADLAAALRSMTASNLVTGQAQNLTSIFNDAAGNPLHGKVAVGRSNNPLIDGVVKMQKIYENPETGKKSVQSQYVTFRAISEIGKAWVNPGFEGAHIFDGLDAQVEKAFEGILKAFT